MLKTLTLLSIIAASSLSAASFFPLDPGNTWTYRNSTTGRAFTVRVALPSVINGKTYFTLQGYVDSDVLVRTNEQNTLVYLDNNTNEEKPLVSFTPQDSFINAPYRTCDQESQTQQRRGTYNGPSGEFRDVVEVRFRSSCADAGTELEQFSENIGMLRRVEQSIAGPQQYDLVYASIGSMVVNALPTGLFSVTLDQVNGSDQLTAVLRLRLNGAPLKLSFPSSQEYDLALRDENGNTVWFWSADKSFLQAFHDKTIVTDLTIPVMFPRPGNPSATPQPVNYTLHAWLTTDGEVPAFAATVSVTIATPITK